MLKISILLKIIEIKFHIQTHPWTGKHFIRHPFHCTSRKRHFGRKGWFMVLPNFSRPSNDCEFQSIIMTLSIKYQKICWRRIQLNKKIFFGNANHFISDFTIAELPGNAHYMASYHNRFVLYKNQNIYINLWKTICISIKKYRWPKVSRHLRKPWAFLYSWQLQQMYKRFQKFHRGFSKRLPSDTNIQVFNPSETINGIFTSVKLSCKFGD